MKIKTILTTVFILAFGMMPFPTRSAVLSSPADLSATPDEGHMASTSYAIYDILYGLDITLDYNTSTDYLIATWTPKPGYRNFTVTLTDSSGSVLATKTPLFGSRVSFRGSLMSKDDRYRVTLKGNKLGRSSILTLDIATHTYNPAPTLTETVANSEMNDMGLWFFAIDDGETELAASGEYAGEIYLGRLDITAPEDDIDWEAVITSDMIDEEWIADHWHVYAHGYHWITFSLAGTHKSYLAQINTSLELLDLQVIADEVDLGSGTIMPTNDMFLVEEDSGIAIGHFNPVYGGHRVYRYDTSGSFVEYIDIGGGSYSHANGSSAIQNDEGYVVFATQHIGDIESEVYFIQFDEDWNETSIATLISETDANVAFSSAIETDDYYIVNARVVNDISGTNEDGHIVQYIFDEELNELSRTIVADDTGYHRPHTTLFGDQVITTWDTSGTIEFRVDDISY